MGFKGRGPPGQGGGAAQEAKNILELDYSKLGEYAEDLVERKLRHVSMTRIRRLHQEIARIRDAAMRDGGLGECRKLLPRLRYLLAYTYGRLGEGERRNFREYMDALKKAIDGILQRRDSQGLREGVEKLYMFSEAIVAYHKYYEEGGEGGR
jgi:CRISPR type III-A-associated protein Csm2